METCETTIKCPKCQNDIDLEELNPSIENIVPCRLTDMLSGTADIRCPECHALLHISDLWFLWTFEIDGTTIEEIEETED